MTATPNAHSTIERWITAFNAADSAAVAALYSPQALLWGTTADTLIDTPDGVRRYFDHVLALQPPPTVALGEMQQRTAGAVAVLAGRYDLTLLVDGTLQTLPARFSFTCVQQGDAWLIADHHSSWLPAPLVAATRS